MARFVGKVIDNDSSNSPEKDKNGRCKLFIYGIHSPNELTKNLPWAMCSRIGNFIPEIGEYVLTEYLDEKNYKKLVYSNKLSLTLNNTFKKFEDDIKSKLPGWSGSYPDNKFTFYPNGSCSVVNSNTGEYAYYQQTGTYFYIPSDGKIILQTNGSDIEINGNTKNFVTHAELDAALQTYVTAVNALFGTKLNGGGSPGTLLLDILSSKTLTVKTG